MAFYERYLSGETKAVHDELLQLGAESFSAASYPDVEKVFAETFSRVAHNLKIIYAELRRTNYLFLSETQYQERPLLPPFRNTDKLLTKLDQATQPFGYVPLSLRYFYKFVGGVDFTWDYETQEEFRWNMADPVVICSLKSLVEEVAEEYWCEDIQQYVDDENFGFAFFELAPDDLHKDNTSGGPPYSLRITRDPSLDAPFLNEPHNTTFINYLRLCFEHCGFPGITRTDHNNDYRDFFAKVKPLLKPI
ncbi:MAG: hypothetical protein ACRYFX_15070 [Janthinobacterium lividum]